MQTCMLQDNTSVISLGNKAKQYKSFQVVTCITYVNSQPAFNTANPNCSGLKKMERDQMLGN